MYVQVWKLECYSPIRDKIEGLCKQSYKSSAGSNVPDKREHSEYRNKVNKGVIYIDNSIL